MDVAVFVENEPALVRALACVRDLGLPDAWIGAGFVRNAVWDRLHGVPASSPSDIDVAYFDPSDVDPACEREAEARLRTMAPDLPWQVRNQARMHARHGHAPYRNAADAVARWVDTATAVAARLDDSGKVVLMAPHGAADLVGLVLRPVPAYRARLDVFHARIAAKGWLRRWPRLIVVED